MQLLRDDDTLLLVPPSETKTSIDLARLGNRALEPDDAESERYQVGGHATNKPFGEDERINHIKAHRLVRAGCCDGSWWRW